MRICPIFWHKITPFTLKMEMHHLMLSSNFHPEYQCVYIYIKYSPKLLTAHIYFVFQINPYSLKYVVSPTAPPTIYVLVQCIAIHREHCDYVFLSTCINISETSVEIITANWLTTVSTESLLNAFQPFYLLKLYEWFGMVALVMLMKIFFVFLFFL